ncbi:hypothetical protein RU98_GL002454 [Enterococcus caccae]|nr:hypothetical protein RU98_GL002454 [Enterococcus caccae]
MDSKKLDTEMIKVVKSDEAKKVFEEGIKNIDPKAFTNDGVIHSYKIDEESIKHSPMGSIIVNIIINGDDRLVAKFDLNKRTGTLNYGGVDISGELSDLKREAIGNE